MLKLRLLMWNDSSYTRTSEELYEQGERKTREITIASGHRVHMKQKSR